MPRSARDLRPLLLTTLLAGCTIVDPQERLVVELGTSAFEALELTANGSPTTTSDSDADLRFVDLGVGLSGSGRFEPAGERHRLWRFEGRVGGGDVGGADLGELAVGGRFYHPEVAGLVPFLSTALVLTWFDERDEVNSDAQTGLRLGAGVEVDLGESLFLFAAVDHTFVLDESNTLTSNFDVIETDYEGWALRLGIGWLF